MDFDERSIVNFMSDELGSDINLLEKKKEL